ncbi:MAG: hypothetical protein NTV49_07700 [Kiritimatiellaeota bacterium]|nr:hypothetical protein [Kiritimatiellota bacterium]
MLDQAFEALKTYDWGVEPKVLQPIEQALVSTRGDAAARQALEARLLAVLQSDAPRAAKDYVCRQLRTVGTAAAVPALAALLPNAELSHMARYALERIPDPKAGAALCEQLPKLGGKLKIGVISSLGARSAEAEAAPRGGLSGFLARLRGASRGGTVSLLRALLADPDAAVAQAAARALGALASPAADQALAAAQPTSATRAALADAALACAEKLRAAGNPGAARATYERLLKNKPAPLVRAAAERGLKGCGA